MKISNLDEVNSLTKEVNVLHKRKIALEECTNGMVPSVAFAPPRGRSWLKIPLPSSCRDDVFAMMLTAIRHQIESCEKRLIELGVDIEEGAP